MLGLKKKVKTGSEAVEEALAGFEGIIQSLGEAVMEVDDERIEAEYAVKAAENDRDRIEVILDKGYKFLKGLKALLQG